MCGCTDERACIDLETGEPCHWQRSSPGLCSCCDEIGGPGFALRSWPLPEPSGDDGAISVVAEEDMPACCRRAGERPEAVADGGGFECPDCGAVWIGERETVEDEATPPYCGDPGCWVCRERGLIPEGAL
jgi:hypothetical protein